MSGKQSRLRRILNPKTGKGLVVAIDHGYALGPMSGLVNPKKVIEQLSPYCDAWMMTKGIYSTCYDPDGAHGMILRISGGATIAGPDITNESIVSSVEEALRVDADAVSVNCFIGFENEHSTLKNLGKVSDACRKWNMPLAGVHAAGKDRERMIGPESAKLVALGARVLAELGADIVKTYYTSQDFEKVVAGCPVPVMIAGGPKCETDADTLRMIRSSLDQGAAGIVMGRNIWQTENPVRLIKIVRAMIHEDLKLDEGIRMLGG